MLDKMQKNPEILGKMMELQSVMLNKGYVKGPTDQPSMSHLIKIAADSDVQRIIRELAPLLEKAGIKQDAGLMGLLNSGQSSQTRGESGWSDKLKSFMNKK